MVKRIIGRLFKHRVIVIRGTPGSGKTVLRHLIHRTLAQNRLELSIHVSRGWPEGLDGFQSTRYLEEATGRTEDELFGQPSHVIIIDDAQSSYYDDQLWGDFLKSLESGQGAVVLLLSAYGSATGPLAPVRTGTPPFLSPEKRISLRWSKDTPDEPGVGILLTDDESRDLIERSCGMAPDSQDQLVFSPQLCSYLTRLSGGHAGALSGLVGLFVILYLLSRYMQPVRAMAAARRCPCGQQRPFFHL